MKSSIRRFLKTIAIIAAVVVTPGALFFGFWFASSAGSDRGSPQLASEWLKLISEFDNPQSAATANERIWTIQCENGEWLFGLAQSSHGIWKRGGGTIAIKDSDGHLATFRGHVCWSSGSPFRGCSTTDLATVYEEIAGMGFKPLAADVASERSGHNKPAPTNP